MFATSTASSLSTAFQLDNGSPIRELLDPGSQADPAPASLSRLEADALVESGTFVEALTKLCKWQSWLQVGGELVVRTQTPWAIDTLRRVLVALGFRVDGCQSALDAGQHLTTIHATQTSHPDAFRVRNTVQKLLAQIYEGEAYAEAWQSTEQELARLATRHDSGIVLRDDSTAVASQTAPDPVVSIIVLTFNALADTKLCLDSLEQHTTTAHEVVLVDNASTDGTRDYLKAWADKRENVRLILNDDNLGFAAGNNIGMAVARGRYLVLLNNDTIVTTGWCERLIGACERNPNVALVGPRSNAVSGSQIVRHAPYKTPEQMHAFAQRWTRTHLGREERAIRLVGFCLLVRRELVDEIGGLDERFGRGNFEDDDFCLRAAAKGYEARIAHDVFIHHSGSKSFRAANINIQDALEANWRIFKDKWGIPAERTLEQGYPSTLTPPETAMQFIELPNIDTTHQAIDDNARFMVSNAAQPASPPQEDKSPIATMFDAAEAAAQRGDWEGSAKIFEEMVHAAPTFGPGYVGLASAAFATGQLEAGMVALEHACTIYPKNAELRTQLGVAYAHCGELVKAQETFLQVLDIDDKSVDAIVSLAHLCRASRNYVEAVDLLDHASRLEPDSPVVLGAIGTTALELGDTAGAQVALTRLSAVAPDHPETTQLVAAFSEHAQHSEIAAAQ